MRWCLIEEREGRGGGRGRGGERGGEGHTSSSALAYIFFIFSRVTVVSFLSFPSCNVYNMVVSEEEVQGVGRDRKEKMKRENTEMRRRGASRTREGWKRTEGKKKTESGYYLVDRPEIFWIRAVS